MFLFQSLSIFPLNRGNAHIWRDSCGGVGEKEKGSKIWSLFCGQGQIRTAEAVRQQIYSLPVLTTYLPTRAYLAMQR